MQKNNTVTRIIDFIKTAFLNGLLIILPFTLTIGLFMLSCRILINWLRPAQEFLEHPIAFIANIPYKLILNQVFLVVLGLFLIGAIVRLLLLEPLIHAFENMLFKIPLVRPIYSGIKQLIKAFSVQDKLTFKKVVLVEFPRKGIYSLGFLTSELPHVISPGNEIKFYNVFIPTTPNPTSGYFVILAEHEFSEIDLSRQEAMAMIISGGIIQPDRLTK